MHDVMLSYASQTRPPALELAAALRSNGLTVWMDDSGEFSGDAPVGIPAGQPHWDVIAAAIDAAACVIILNSAHWQAKPYCQKEGKHADTRGKRMLYTNLQPDGTTRPDAVALTAAARDGLELTRAHARLTMMLHAPERRRSRWARLTKTDEPVADAEALLAAVVGNAGIGLPNDLREFCMSLVQTARVRRRRRRGLAMAVLASLLAFAALAVTAAIAGVRAREEAEQRAAEQQSLQLASAALRRTTTADAVEDARSAAELFDSVNSRAAYAQVTAEEQQRTRIRLDAAPYSAVQISDDGQTILAVDNDQLLIVRTAKSAPVHVPLPDRPLSGRASLSPDGTVGSLVTRQGQLLVLDVGTAELEPVYTEAQPHVSVATDDAVYWLDDQGWVSVWRGGRSQRLLGPVPEATILEIDPAARVVYVVLADASVEAHSLDGGGGTLWRSPVPPEANGTTVRGERQADADYLLRCGDRLHVFAGWRTGLLLSRHWVLAADGSRVAAADTDARVSGAVCNGQGGAWTVPMLTPRVVHTPVSTAGPVDVLDDHATEGRVAVASSADGSYAAVLSSDGLLDVLINRSDGESVAAGVAVRSVPLNGGNILLEPGGSLVWRSDSREPDAAIGQIPAAGDVLNELRVAHDGHAAWILNGQNLFQVEQTGVVAIAELPAEMTMIDVSPNGKEVLLASETGILRYPRGLVGAPLSTPVPDLQRAEVISRVARFGDALLIATTFGRLLALDETTGAVRTSFQLPHAGALAVDVIESEPGRAVLAFGADGVARLLDDQLQLQQSALIGPAGASVHVFPDGDRAVLGTTDGELRIVETTSLEVMQRLGRVDIPAFHEPTADGRAVVGVEAIGQRDTDDQFITRVEVRPVCPC